MTKLKKKFVEVRGCRLYSFELDEDGTHFRATTTNGFVIWGSIEGNVRSLKVVQAEKAVFSEISVNVFAPASLVVQGDLTIEFFRSTTNDTDRLYVLNHKDGPKANWIVAEWRRKEGEER